MEIFNSIRLALLKTSVLAVLLSGCQVLTPKQDIGIVEDVIKDVSSDISKKDSGVKTIEDAAEDLVEDVVEDEVGLDLGLNHDHVSQSAVNK